MFRKRSWKESVQDVVKLVRRGLSAEKKPEKKPNEQVARAMGMVNAANAILYLSTAAVAAARIVTVRDSDTTAYKRSLPLELKGYVVNCIPVEKIGNIHYQIGKGAFIDMTQETEPSLNFVKNQDASDVQSHLEPNVEVKTADLSNGHHRLVKRAVIPPQDREETTRKNENPPSFHDMDGIDSKKAQHEVKTSSIDNESKLSIPNEEQLVRRQHNTGKSPSGSPHANAPHGTPGSGGAPHGNGAGQVPVEGPIEVEKIKHIYHVDGKYLDLPSADGSGQEHSIESGKRTKKGGMSKASILGYVAGGGALGYGLHALYSNNQQQQLFQQQQQQAAAAQAAYGYANEQGYPYAVKREIDWQEGTMVKRASSEDDSDILFIKRSPNGRPDIRLTKSEIHWHNVPPEKLPTGARFHGQDSNPGIGPGGAEYTSDGKNYPQEYAVQLGEKKKKGGAGWAKKGLIVAAAAGTGAYLHAAFSPSAPPPPPPMLMPQQMAYGDEYAQQYAQPTYYQKREILQDRFPSSFAIGNDSKGDDVSSTSEMGNEKSSKQDLFKREETSYDDYIRALKKAEEEGEEQYPKVHVLKPRKRDQLQYDADKSNVHFVASNFVNSSNKVGEDEEDDEELERREVVNDDGDDAPQLYRRESTVQFDTDENHASHFKASVPSYPYGDVVDDDEEDKKLERRSQAATITYDGTKDGQHFKASMPRKGESEEEEDDQELERRSEASSVVYDHDKNGTHFVASHPGSPISRDDNDDDDEELERRNIDGKPCDDDKVKDQKAATKIDYTTNKDNEITFHASTPQVKEAQKEKDNVMVDAHYERDSGVVIKIAPREHQQSTAGTSIVRRNQIVADR